MEMMVVYKHICDWTTTILIVKYQF